jgi:hypothetical protein
LKFKALLMQAKLSPETKRCASFIAFVCSEPTLKQIMPPVFPARNGKFGEYFLPYVSLQENASRLTSLPLKPKRNWR